MKPVALITGSGIRIGRRLAQACAESGYRLVLHYHSSVESVQAFSQELTEQGVEHCLVEADLCSPEQVENLFRTIPQEFKSVDLLVNSAAIFPENDRLENFSENWTSLITLNTFAPISLIQQMITHNKAVSEQLQVVNIIDARLSQADGEHLAYRLSKSALKQATIDLAKDLAPKVRVNAIALGAILPPPGKGEDHLMRLAQKIPLQKTGDLEQVAQAFHYLLKQSFVTGEILTLDGGEFL